MTAGSAPLGQDFDLAPGRSVRVEDLEVRMERVADDSRCPIDIECLWPGDATVVIDLLSVSGETSHELHTARQFGDQVTRDDYVVRLVDLLPPRRHAGPKRLDYRARLRVSLTWTARLRRLVRRASTT